MMKHAGRKKRHRSRNGSRRSLLRNPVSRVTFTNDIPESHTSTLVIYLCVIIKPLSHPLLYLAPMSRTLATVLRTIFTPLHTGYFDRPEFVCICPLQRTLSACI